MTSTAILTRPSPSAVTELSFGAHIARLRRRRGLSQVVCAGLIGRTEDWLSKVENDHITIDRLSVLRQLAQVLRVDLTTLIDGGRS